MIRENGIRSIALPPPGCGIGGLEWSRVRSVIERELKALEEIDVVVYEPAAEYQSVAKREGLQRDSRRLAH